MLSSEEKKKLRDDKNRSARRQIKMQKRMDREQMTPKPEKSA